MDIALASSAHDHMNDGDLTYLVEAATQLGHRAQVVVWDDETVDWSNFDKVAIRSCWDYTHRREEFLDWCENVGTRLINTPAIVSWNSDKFYLRDLSEAGVRIIPTMWDVDTVEALGTHQSWVVKPTISAGAANTAHWTDPQSALSHSIELLVSGRHTMTQPYVSSIDTVGEFAIYMFNGTHSHTVRKPALLEADRAPDVNISFPGGLRAVTVEQELVDFAQTAIASAQGVIGQEIVQARVDVVLADSGEPLLMELELVEPALFLDFAPKAARTYIEAITAAG